MKHAWIGALTLLAAAASAQCADPGAECRRLSMDEYRSRM